MEKESAPKSDKTKELEQEIALVKEQIAKNEIVGEQLKKNHEEILTLTKKMGVNNEETEKKSEPNTFENIGENHIKRSNEQAEKIDLLMKDIERQKEDEAKAREEERKYFENLGQIEKPEETGEIEKNVVAVKKDDVQYKNLREYNEAKEVKTGEAVDKLVDGILEHEKNKKEKMAVNLLNTEHIKIEETSTLDLSTPAIEQINKTIPEVKELPHENYQAGDVVEFDSDKVVKTENTNESVNTEQIIPIIETRENTETIEKPEIVIEDVKVQEEIKIGEEKLDNKEEMSVEKNVENSREAYIEEYKKCNTEAKRQLLIDRTKNVTFNILAGAKNIFSKNKIEYKKLAKKEDFFTDKFKESKKEYNKARIEMGNAMYAEKKSELEKNGLSGEELEKALVNYKATEILAKTIIEERQKIINSQTENPTRMQKLLDGYRKMPRWQRVALSTALFTAAAGAGVVTGGVFAGYGLATMATMKFGASMAMGSFIGHSVKGIDIIKKKSDLEFTETQNNKKSELQELFSKGEIQLENYEEEISKIEKEESERARNRILLKAGVGVALAGTAGFIAYDALGNGLSNTDNLHNADINPINNNPEIPPVKTEPIIFEKPNVAPVAPEPVIIPHASIEATADHGQGAISTLRELQNNLKAEYSSDLTNAPESVKHILNTDPHQLAQEYGMYKPGQDAESAFVKSGSSFKVDQAGNVTYHEVGGKDITLQKGTEIKISTQYEGKMSDVDNSGIKVDPSIKIETTPDEYKLPEQITVNTNENLITDEPLNSINNESNLSPYKLPPQVDEVTGESIIPKPETYIKVNENVENQAEIPYRLPEQENVNEITITPKIEQPVNISTLDLEKIQTVYNENINHFFPDNEHTLAWENIKSKSPYDLYKVEAEGGLNETYKPFTSYLHKLEEVTGQRPRGITLTNSEPETTTEFLERALQKAEEMGQLDKVKL